MNYDEMLRRKNKDGIPGKAYDNDKWILNSWSVHIQCKLTLLLLVF